MSDPFLSEIRALSFNFAPRGWATCDGQTMQISQNNALYSLLGIMYGGDGKNYFNLPDMRGRTPIHFNSTYKQGKMSGSETVTLDASTIPNHTHHLMATTSTPTASTPAGNLLATLPADKADFTVPANANTALNTAAVAAAGESARHTNMQPSLVVNFCIALVGVYPPRS